MYATRNGKPAYVDFKGRMKQPDPKESVMAEVRELAQAEQPKRSFFGRIFK